MPKLLLAAVVLAALSVTANADTYTYMCRVGPKFYPVKVTTPKDSLSGGTITWRGTVFKNVELGEGCKANFVAERDGVTIELCTATKGVADLTVGEDTFDCQMK